MSGRRPGARWRPTRRGFLIGLGLGGAGVALGWRYGLPELWLRTARSLEASGAPGGVEGAPQAWLEVRPDGVVELHLPKVEMGQGIHTALAQIAAEELELPWERLVVRQASTARGLRDPFGTGASNSVASLFRPLREAAATMREMLRTRAAERWGVSVADAVVMDGEVFRRDAPAERLGFGELALGAGGWEVPDEPPALKPPAEFRLIGRALPRVDLPDKVTGRAVYGYDARLPGMRYGAVARPPRIGSRLRRAAPGGAAAAPGVEAVVIEDGFAGVVATTRARARAALDLLELEWEPVEPFGDDDIRRLTTVTDGAGVVVQREGNARRWLLRGRLVEAEYRTPIAAHAQLEPQAALVDVRPDEVAVWASTQSPDALRDDLASLLGRPREQVVLTPGYLGGGFGRKLKIEAAFEAARLSRAVGRPVHVGWDRAEEFAHGAHRPPTHSLLRAALAADGSILAIEHQLASGDVAFSLLPPALSLVFGADFGAWRGATIPYDVAHRRTSAERVALPLPTTWWRGLGLLANTFALEGFIDELAAAAGADPLAFRLRHLGAGERSRRLARVLTAAAEAASWDEPPPPGRARGLACCSDTATAVAQVAEVSREDGRLRVHRVTAAVDCGLVINPDGAAAQIQGAIVMGLGSALHERLSVEGGAVVASNFDRYRLPTTDEAPEIDVVLLPGGDEPFGLGEPPIGPVAAAVANAAARLDGRRLRELPLAPG